MISAGGNPEDSSPPAVPTAGNDAGEPPDLEAAVMRAGGQGPLRLIALAVTLFIFGFALRWGQDAVAPYVNLGEADMAGTVVFEADAGTYRVVTSGPNRPAIHTTYCEARGVDGFKHRERGEDGVDGGQEHFGVTRVTKFVLPAGRAEIQCGDRAPDRGEGLGRFQVVAADGPTSYAVIGLLIGGSVSLAIGLGWFVLRYRRQST